MKTLVTGTAGFIGSHVALRLLDRGDEVVGIDNLSDYYDVTLKQARLARFIDHPNYAHIEAPGAIEQTQPFDERRRTSLVQSHPV